MTTRLQTRLGLVAMLFFAACSGDCSCDGFVSQPFPPSKFNQMVPSSGLVRVTPTGLAFLEQNLPTIIEGVVPGGLNFCVPESTGSPSVCYRGETCTSGGNGCDMTVTIDDATITPQPSDTLLIDITLGDLDERLSVGLIGADCFLDLHATGNTNLPATVDATLPMTFTVDPQSPTNDVRIATGDLDADLANLDFAASGDLLCFAANLGFVKNLVKDQLIGQLDPILSGVIEEQLCTSCADAPCQTGVCNADDICEFAATGECVPLPLGVEGVLQIGSVIGDFSENPTAEVDTFVRVADHALVDTGLSLGLRNAFDPVELANCVPVDPSGRDFTAAPLSPTVAGNLKPNGTPFMMGVAYHERALEHMLWSVWGSGATCIRIGTANIDLLTTGLFGAILPSIKELALNKTSELYIKIVPQNEPVVALGANTVTDNGNGTYTIDEPLMNIDWKDFDVHIYAFAQSRFTRVATIRMDLLIPVALVPTNMGEIVPILGDLGDAITNERVLQTELIQEDPQRLLDLLPTLIGMALPALADSLSDPIALPEFFGFRVDIGPGDITSVDGNTQIALFADLVIAGTPVSASLDTRITEMSVNYDKRAMSGLIKPRVTVTPFAIPTEGFQPLDATPMGEIEYSYRVNGGTWSLPIAAEKIVIEDPLFVIPGEHTVELRARYKGDFQSEDMTPAVQKILIDYAAPDLEIEQRTDRVEIDASDDVSKHLEFRHRIVTSSGSTEWSAWTSARTIELAPAERTRIDVEARDEAGNIAKTTQNLRAVKQGLQPAPTSTGTPAAGCATTGNNGTPAALLLLLVGLIGLRIRRRKTNWATPLLFIVLMFGACKCGDDTGNQCQCADNESCVDNQCVPSTCMTDADCTGGNLCVNFECVAPDSCEATCECADGEFGGCDDADMCVCEAYCPDGCGDGEYCCYQSNSCEATPDPCADTLCEQGFQPEADGDPAGDSETCGSATTCACVPVPPLDIGKHGQFTSFDQANGVTAIANYNTTYGDLMVGIANGQDVTWYWVDGVPADGMVTGAEDGPRGGISTKGEDVGTHTALGIDASGNLHIFYRDEERSVMKYARGVANGANYDFTIADFDTDGDTGYWPSVEMDGNSIHLVYSSKAFEAMPGSFETRLNYALIDAAASPDALNPVSEVIDSTTAANPCGFECAGQERCFQNIGVCGSPTADCAVDCGDDTCYMATCEPVYEVPPAAYDDVVGSYTELSLTTDGLLLVYFDKFQDTVKWTRQTTGTWSVPTLVGATSGPFASGVVDGNGAVHMAYQDRSEQRLVYESPNGIEVIQTGLRDTANWWLINEIGEDVQLRQNGAGNFVVVYQDATEHILKRSERTAADAWNTTDIALPSDPYTGSHGFYISMLKDGAADVLVNTVINNQLETATSNPVLYE